MLAVTLDRTIRRIRRVRAYIRGSEARPRVSVFRSNKYIYAQAIDDEKKVTVASATSLFLKKTGKKAKKSDESKQVGQELAKALLEKNIKMAIFDRGRYAYNGRVKMLAEGLREGGIIV